MNESDFLISNEIEEREKEIINIHNELIDIHSIFGMLNQLATDQGYIIGESPGVATE
jgi:hypothetical protein